MPRYQIWKVPDGAMMFGLPRSEAELDTLLGPDRDKAVLLSEFDEDDSDRAGVRYNETLGFEPYRPMYWFHRITADSTWWTALGDTIRDGNAPEELRTLTALQPTFEVREGRLEMLHDFCEELPGECQLTIDCGMSKSREWGGTGP